MKGGTMFGTGTRLIVVGYGNMGRAIVHGLAHFKALSYSQVTAVEPSAGLRATAAETGATAVSDFASLDPITPRDAVLLSVKPQVFPEIAAGLASRLPQRSGEVLVVSVMAGVSTATLGAALPGGRIVRAMPNMGAGFGQSATAISLGPRALRADGSFALEMFRCIGPMVAPLDERLMDAFTAVAGSGPAYVFLLAQAMFDAAVAAGIEPPVASAAVRQTIAGAAAVLQGDNASSADELRARVTSKGGTTEAALRVLGERGVYQAVFDAVLAARDRGEELGRQAR